MRGIRPFRLLILAVAALNAQTVDRALDALANNDTPAAERELEALSRAKPQDQEVAVARGVYLFQLGKFLQARQVLEPVAADPRGETFLLLSRAATGECAAVASGLR